ncbi:MAG: TonB-dependent receptor [bacterium]|nr:TonB-dependent receptor [bacterium]
MLKIVILAFIAVFLNSFATQEDKSVLTATKTEMTLKELCTAVSIIGVDEIDASNATSCTDIIGNLPGVFVMKTGAFGRADVNIRGIGGNGTQLMVLIDGMPVKTGLFGWIVTHSLPLNNVERIEVVRGPLSVLYGSDALGGVINIITKRPRKEKEVNYTASYGTYRTYGYQICGGGTFGNFSCYFTSDRKDSDGHLYNSEYQGEDYTTRLGYKLSKNTEVSFLGKYFEAEKEEPAPSPDGTFNDYKTTAFDITLNSKGKWWDGSFKIYHNYGHHLFSDGWHLQDFTNGTIANFSNNNIIMGNELNIGAEYRQQGGKEIYEPDTGTTLSKYEYGIWCQDEYRVLDRFILSAGVRYNWDEVSGKDISPQVGAILHLRDGATLRSRVAKGFRAPSLNELFMFTYSNKELNPEVVWNYECGLSQQIVEGVNIDVTLYRMEGNNLIQISQGRTNRFQNTGRFEFKGIEASIITQLKRLNGHFSYSYLNTAEHTQGRPGTKVDAVLMYSPDRSGLGISLSAQYVTDYFAQDSSNERIDDYIVVNTKLAYKLIPVAELFLAIDNILDRDYKIWVDLPGASAGKYIMPGRTFTAGLSIKL